MRIPDSYKVLMHEILEKIPDLVAELGTPFGTAPEIALLLTDSRPSALAVSTESVGLALQAGELPCVRSPDGSPVFWLQMPERSPAGAADFCPTHALQAFVKALGGKPTHQPSNLSLRIDPSKK